LTLPIAKYEFLTKLSRVRAIKIANQDEETWTCKHCGHSVDSNDKANHPSGCDCPTCFPFDRYAEEHPCEDGHSWSPDIGGRICEVCGIKAKGAYAKYEYDDTGRYCNDCSGYVCFCKEGNDDDEDWDNMSL
jgi:hypothetical protein